MENLRSRRQKHCGAGHKARHRCCLCREQEAAGRQWSRTPLARSVLGTEGGVAGSCVVKTLSVSLAAKFAGFRGLDLVNLAITTNARGGPGIVLASVAFDAGIISPKFYTTLVVAAVLTSQFAGVWLDYVCDEAGH